MKKLHIFLFLLSIVMVSCDLQSNEVMNEGIDHQKVALPNERDRDEEDLQLIAFDLTCGELSFDIAESFADENSSLLDDPYTSIKWYLMNSSGDKIALERDFSADLWYGGTTSNMHDVERFPTLLLEIWAQGPTDFPILKFTDEASLTMPCE